MRILKRNLAFVLAMVMALSLTVSAMGVEDYSDVNEIAFVEAVDVMTEMGILEGTDGEFNPTKVLNRAEAAKIIAYMLLGKTAADNLQAVTAPFADVPANHWAAGYIAHCVNEGIINGVSATEYNPKGELTATAFAKMLLSAVGYNVNGEFTGTRWETEVNALALKLGVFNGNLGANLGAGCTREEAALYAFNTMMKIDTVKYSELFGTYYTGTSVLSNDGAMTLNEQLYGYKKSTTVDEATDAFGRVGHVWLNNKNKVVTGMYASEADAVYTTEVKSKTVYADLGLTAAETATVLENGRDGADFSITKKGTNTIGGNGVLTEVYVSEVYDEAKDEYDTVVNVVMIHTYLAKVESVNAKKETVTIEAYGAGSKVNTTVETTEFEKDDMVLVTMAMNDTTKKYDVQTIELAETVVGEITARSKGNYVKLDGEKYEYAADAVKANLDGAAFEVENTLYVDNYGYAMDIAEVGEEAGSVEGYVLVTNADMDEDRFGTDEGAVVKVKFFADGTSEVLNLAVEKKDDVLKFKTVQPVNGEDEVVWVELNEKNVTDLISETTVYGYNMTEDGEIVLVNVEGDYIYNANTSVDFDGERVGKVFGDSFRLNAATVATVVEDEDVATYEGYEEIDFAASGVKVLVINSGTLLKEIYVLGNIGTEADEAVTVYFGGAEGEVEELNDTYTWLLVYGTDGETIECTIKTVDMLTAGKAYDVKLDANNKITSVVEEHGVATVLTVAKDGMSFTIDQAWGEDTWYIAEDVTIWNVESGIVADSLEVGDKVSFDVDKFNTVVEMFIVDAAE